MKSKVTVDKSRSKLTKWSSDLLRTIIPRYGILATIVEIFEIYVRVFTDKDFSDSIKKSDTF